jgi:hypothetical protein
MSRRPTHLALYLGLLHRSETTLAEALRTVAEGHAADADVYYICDLLAGWSEENVQRLKPMIEKYGEQDVDEPSRLYAEGLPEVRSGPVGLLRDLQDLTLLATLVSTSWTAVGQAAQGNRDGELKEIVDGCSATTNRQLAWLNHRMKQVAPQALVVSGTSSG